MAKEVKFKMDPQQQTAVLANIKTGCPIEHACKAAGFSNSTFFNYKKRAKAILETHPEVIINGDMGKLTEDERGYVEFLQGVKKAEGEAVLRNIAVVSAAAQKHWVAAAWWLERRYPDQFGRRERIDNRYPDGIPVHPDFDLKKLSKDELIDLARIQEKARADEPEKKPASRSETEN